MTRQAICIACAAWLLDTAAGMAATYDWQHNSVSTDWANTNNWRVGAAIPSTPPGAGDIANFPTINPIVNQPMLDGPRSVLGLIFNDHASTDWQINGAGKTLTIGASGIAKIGQRGTTLIAPDVVLNGSQTWYAQNTEGLIRVHTVQLNGTLTGTSDLNMEWRGGGAFTFAVAGGPRTPSGVAINGSVRAAGSALTLNYNVGLQNASDIFVFGGTPATPTPLTLDSGATLQVSTTTTVTGVTVDLANPLQVESGGGVLTSAEPQGVGTGVIPLVRFTGALRLGGPLYLNRPRTAPADCLTGTVTLNRISAGTAAFIPVMNGYNAISTTEAGNIVDGSGPFANPLILLTTQDTFTLSGSGNTYGAGTVVDHTGEEYVNYSANTRGAQVVVGAGSSLGSRDVVVLPGGKIRIPASTAVGGSAAVHILSSTCDLGVFGVGYDGKPTLASDSSGVLALDATFTGSINLASLGNGRMFLGTCAGGTYSGATLGVGADNTYRLGGGTYNQTLTVSSANVITGTATLQVGRAKWHGTGIVLLNKAQDYTGATEVNGQFTYDRNAGVSSWGSTLTGVAQSTGSPFGDVAGAVTLRNSYLTLTGASGGQAVTKGQLSFQGRSYVSVNDTSSYATYMTFTSSNRVNRGTLVVQGVKGHLGGTERILIAAPNGPGMVNGIVAPNVMALRTAATAGNHFATYSAATGFGEFGGYVALPAGGAGTEVALVSSTVAVNDTRTIYALKTTADITGSGKLVITGGGIITSANISPAVDFGSAEGVMWYDVVGRSLSGVVSGTKGITVSSLLAGRDPLTLSNTGNDFTGQITVAGGTLAAAFDTSSAKGSLGNLDNDILLDGGVLRATAGDRLQATRSITLGEGGGMFYYYNATMTIYGPIGGPGALIVGQGPTTLILDAVNSYQGGTRLVSIGTQGTANLIVNANSSVGTGDVQLEPGTFATFKGDANVANGACVYVAGYATAKFQSAAPTLGGLGGSGTLVLGTNAVSDTTLSVGGGNVSSTFYGTISQVSATAGQGRGILTKTGNGTFTLYGAHSYTGSTTVNAGTFMLMGSVAGSLAVGSAGTLGGSGQVKGDLSFNSGGKLSVVIRSDAAADVIAVGGAANIAGAALDVSFAAGYTPPKTGQWTILTAGACNGDFASVTPGFGTRNLGNAILVTKSPKGTLIEVR